MRFLILILLFTAGCKSVEKESSYDTLTKSIFFEGNIDTVNHQLLQFYSSHQGFSTVEGVTIYPPLSALGQGRDTVLPSYRFFRHPFLKFAFKEGLLRFPMFGKGEGYPIMMQFYFGNAEQKEAGWKELYQLYLHVHSTKQLESEKNGTRYVEFVEKGNGTRNLVSLFQQKSDSSGAGEYIMLVLDQMKSLKIDPS